MNSNPWVVYEGPVCPDQLGQYEALLTIGNGYVGVRGKLEETNEESFNSTLVHGIFNYVEGDLSPDLAPVPEWLGLTLTFAGQVFRLDQGRVLGNRRWLDLQTATLWRQVLWQDSQQNVIRIEFVRFASLVNEHVMVMQVRIKALNGAPELTIHGGLNSQITNSTGFNHWQPWQSGHTGHNQVWLSSKTNQSGYGLAISAALLTDANAKPEFIGDPKHPQVSYRLPLIEGETFTFTKLVALHTSRDSADPLAAAQTTLAQAALHGYNALYEEHCRAWQQVWSTSDIEIEGDEFAQQAIRFSMYHVLIAAPRPDEQVSIGAKTLSGPGYRGHVFWDTDLFMVPMLTVTQPQLSRNLMMYRYHRLPGARAKATAEGYKGAMFPWESADTGEEVTPKWTPPDAEGKRIRIWTGDIEQHVTSDIAYSMIQYWQWSGDDAFMRDHGAEVILDGARFWASRVEWNETAQRYEITQTQGPDEYHEHVNNSVFTNRMARWHLETALLVWDWLNSTYPATAHSLADRLGFSESERAHWQNVIERIYLPFDSERQIHVQFDGFFDLKPVDVLAYEPRVHSLQSIFGYEATLSLRVIKQADVVMLIALLGEDLAPQDVLLNDWHTYYPLCDHGSSLSPAVHAWVAARLGFDELAYDLFLHAAGIDLLDNKGNSRDGIHGAACGGLWQAIVLGFAGLHLTDHGPVASPRLPSHWRRLKFCMCYHGQTYRVEIRQGGEVRIVPQ